MDACIDAQPHLAVIAPGDNVRRDDNALGAVEVAIAVGSNNWSLNDPTRTFKVERPHAKAHDHEYEAKQQDQAFGCELSLPAGDVASLSVIVGQCCVCNLYRAVVLTGRRETTEALVPLGWALRDAGVALGPIFAFVITAASLSLPESVLLSRIFKLRLILGLVATITAIAVLGALLVPLLATG